MTDTDRDTTESAVDAKDVRATPQSGTGYTGETGARPQHENSADGRGDLEQRRETQQNPRPTTDGMGDGIAKDAG